MAVVTVFLVVTDIGRYILEIHLAVWEIKIAL